MNLRDHVRPVGLVLSLLLAVAVVTMLVALRLQPAAPRSAAPPATVVATPAAVAVVDAPGAAAASVPIAGQCLSDAVSLMEPDVPDVGIAGGLVGVQLPTATPYGR